MTNSNKQLNKGDTTRGIMTALTGRTDYDGVDHSSTYEADKEALKKHLETTERIRECRKECNLEDFV